MDNNPPEIPPHEFLPANDRSRHYQEIIEALYLDSGNNFADFVEGNESLVEIGNTLLTAIKQPKSSGYNILQSQEAMDITSNEPLVFYNNYITNGRHFGLLLSKLEQEKIITEDKLSFGVKATIVKYDPIEDVGWSIDSTRLISLPSTTLKGYPSVEAVVAFKPRDEDQAVQIANRIYELTKQGEPEALPGSWEVNDIRMTSPLQGLLRSDFFETIRTNILHQEGKDGRLLVLHDDAFSSPWKNTATPVNVELATVVRSR